MKKVIVSEPVVVAQSTTEPIMYGGYQDPQIRCDEKGVLYVLFHRRLDDCKTFGQEDGDAVYRSQDMGQTWEECDYAAWLMAQKPLPNGDRLTMREHPWVFDFDSAQLPSLPENREKTYCEKGCCHEVGITYTVDELMPLFGDKIAKNFRAARIKKGETEAVEEFSKVNWKDMTIGYIEYCKGLRRMFPTDKYRVDKDGVLWMPVHGGSVAPDGSVNSLRACVHLFKSEDFGHTWDYVSTIVYKEEYHHPDTAYGVEGFNEATLEILDDGSFLVLMRSGSISAIDQTTAGSPIAACYMARSYDQGETWCDIKPFYEYGVRPQSVKLDCGSIVMISGRPDVYIRTTDDPKAEEWNDTIHLIDIPEEQRFSAFHQYTCSNCDVCAYDSNTAFVTYAHFMLNTPEGERAKSILVSKVTIEED